MSSTERSRPPAPRPPLLHRIGERRWQRIDFVLVGLLVVASLPKVVSMAQSKDLFAALLLLLVWASVAAAVAVRRRSPELALALVIGAAGLGVQDGSVVLADALVALPMYSLAATRARRISLVSLALAAGLLAAFGVVTTLHHHPANAPLGVLVAVAAWFVGDSVRVRRVYVAGLADQAAQRQRETLERAQRSVAEERLQIARELHDVVAHSLSVIAIQSGVGRHVIDSNPAEAKRALGAVEETSRAALDELRHMLGVLRRDERAPAALTPSPGLGSLPQLVEMMRAAGLDVVLETGDAALPLLSSGAELSIYRIVQEALTNVVKHAGRAAAAVTLHDDGQSLLVEILDDGGPVLPAYPSNGESASGHHGIVGMRERVAVFGGTLETGPRPEGGFRICARFPLERIRSATP